MSLGFIVKVLILLVTLVVQDLSALQCYIAEGEPISTKVCDLEPNILGFHGAPEENKIQIASRSDEFEINGNYELVTKSKIDRETLISQKKCKNQENLKDSQIECVLSLELILPDNRISPIEVYILDVNDNVPKFDVNLDNGLLRFEIDEDATDPFMDSMPSLAMKYTNISELPLAIDSDYGVNGSITYSLEGQDSEIFHLDRIMSPDGQILSRLRLYMIGPVDYEKKSEFKLNLIAYNNQTTLNRNYISKSVLPIIVKIKDINEYSPQFDFPNSNTVEINIPESIPIKSKIYQVKATDGDKSETPYDASIKYSINQVASSNIRSTFRMNEQDGSIYLIRKLDYELGEREYPIPILAMDSGSPPKTSSGTVLVQITDVNDEAPDIEMVGIPVNPDNSAASFFVSEKMPAGTFIAKIKVSDKDSGRGGQVHCFLTTSKPFTNYNKMLLHSNYATGMEEDFKLTQIPPSSPSYQSEAEFNLVTNKMFDREQKDAYLLDVICNDFGDEMLLDKQTQDTFNIHSKKLISQKQITIKIKDVNDNGPKFFRRTFTGSIQEALQGPEKILTLEVVDEDLPESNRNRFRFKPMTTPHDIQETFHIDPKTGVIQSTHRLLDRETRNNYEFTVEVFDELKPEEWLDSANVSITILDKNDNSPELAEAAIFEVEEQDKLRENVNQKLFIGKLNATDKDIGPNGEVTFKLDTRVDPSLSKYWSIRSDGSIYAHVNSQFNLDRENQSTHLIPIILQDRGQPDSMSTSVTVTVMLRDVNDNSPVFERPQSRVLQDKSIAMPTDYLSISVETPADSVVYQVFAKDSDDHKNAEVSYEIQKSPLKEPINGEYFEIDEKTGEIRLKQPLSLDDVQVPRKLIITASDGGVNQKRRSFAVLHIKMVTKEMAEREEMLKLQSKESSLSNDQDRYGSSSYQHGNTDQSGLNLNQRGRSGQDVSSVTEIAMGLGIGLIFLMALCLTGIVGVYMCNNRNPTDSASALGKFICCGICREPTGSVDSLKFKASNQYQNQNCNYETLNIRPGLPQGYYSRTNIYPVVEGGQNGWYHTASRMEKGSAYEFIMPATGNGGVRKAPTMNSISTSLKDSANYSRGSEEDQRHSDGLIHPVPRRLPTGFSAIQPTCQESENAYVYTTTMNNISPDTVISNEENHQTNECDEKVRLNKHHAGYVVGSPNYSSSFV